MTLEEREKEMMEKFQALDEKQQEKMAMAERWRRAGLDWDSLTEEQQKGYENWDKIIIDMELYIAKRISRPLLRPTPSCGKMHKKRRGHSTSFLFASRRA